MRRGLRPGLTLAVVCLVAAGCARVAPNASAPPPSSPVAWQPPILLSIPSDSIYQIDPSDGSLRVLASDLLDFQAGFAAWAPDHARIAFGDKGVVVQDQGGDRRFLVRGQSLSMPAWSPDGSRLAYGDGLSLWVTSAATPHPVALPLPRSLAPLEMTWAPGPVIAFTGLELACGIQPGTCLSTSRSDIWTIRPDGSGLRRLTRIGDAFAPRWSPDGSSLLLIRRLTSSKVPHGSQLWEVGANGKGLRRMLPQTDVLAADWSPDGRSIALVRRTDLPDDVQVWIMNANGSDFRPVGDPVFGADATVDW